MTVPLDHLGFLASGSQRPAMQSIMRSTNRLSQASIFWLLFCERKDEINKEKSALVRRKTWGFSFPKKTREISFLGEPGDPLTPPFDTLSHLILVTSLGKKPITQ
jgi:hypothetical protein